MFYGLANQGQMGIGARRDIQEIELLFSSNSSSDVYAFGALASALLRSRSQAATISTSVMRRQASSCIWPKYPQPTRAPRSTVFELRI